MKQCLFSIMSTQTTTIFIHKKPFLLSKALVLGLSCSANQKRILCLSLLALTQRMLKNLCPLKLHIKSLYILIDEYFFWSSLQIQTSFPTGGVLILIMFLNSISCPYAWAERDLRKSAVMSSEDITIGREFKPSVEKEWSLGNLWINGSSNHFSCQNRIVSLSPNLQAADALK